MYYTNTRLFIHLQAFVDMYVYIYIHTAVVEVGAGGGRQREAGGRVSAATAHGTWCRGCRQHTATRGTTLQRTAAAVAL